MTPQDLPLAIVLEPMAHNGSPAAETGRNPAQSGLGDGHHVRRENSPPDCFLVLLTPDGARRSASVLSRWRPMPHSTSPPCRTGSPAACCPGGCRSRWRPTSALKLLKMHWRASASPTTSTWSMVAPSVRAAMRRQGSQFTSADFIKVLAGAEIKISMDGKRGLAG